MLVENQREHNDVVKQLTAVYVPQGGANTTSTLDERLFEKEEWVPVGNENPFKDLM